MGGAVRHRPSPGGARLIVRGVAVAGALALLACGGEAGPREAVVEDTAGMVVAEPRARDDAAAVSLVDSLPWSNLLDEGLRRRVLVTTPSGADTIPGVAVTREPVRAADGTLHGFAVESDGSVSGGFRYDPATGEMRSVPLPGDFLDFTAYALSPDARWLAYAGRAADGVRLAAILRRWPDGEAVYQGDAIEGYPSDASNSEVEWHGTDSVEIRIRTSDVETPGGTWLRLRGVPGSEMLADTVRGAGD